MTTHAISSHCIPRMCNRHLFFFFDTESTGEMGETERGMEKVERRPEPFSDASSLSSPLAFPSLLCS